MPIGCNFVPKKKKERNVQQKKLILFNGKEKERRISVIITLRWCRTKPKCKGGMRFPRHNNCCCCFFFVRKFV